MTDRDLLKVFVADDEELARDRLTAMLDQHPQLVCIGQASDGAAAASGIKQLSPDIVFLDVHMPAATGMEVAEHLQGGSAPAVIFVTAHPDFAAQAFDIDATDYVLKPITPERLNLALSRARRRLGANNSAQGVPLFELPAAPDATKAFSSSFEVETRGGKRHVDVQAIEWIEAAKDYVILHTPHRSHLLRATMDAMEQALDPELMIRISRSAIVRKDAVKSVVTLNRGLGVLLGDGMCIRTGTTYLRRVKAAFLGRHPHPVE